MLAWRMEEGEKLTVGHQILHDASSRRPRLPFDTPFVGGRVGLDDDNRLEVIRADGRSQQT